LEAASVHAPAGLHRISVPLLRLRSDEQLVALFRQGHEDAFQVIHDRYRQRLFAYARQMLSGSRSDAEDAMQDVFLRAYGALRADERPVTLRAWLYRVAHNRCIDQLRRTVPAPIDVFDVTRGPSLFDPLEQAERREDLSRLVHDVRRLPEHQRSALLMREMEGLTYKELGDALNVSIPAVKSLLVRARIGLVEAIEARDTACCDIRVDIAAAFDRGVRASGRSRRHVRECDSCREYRGALRGGLKELQGLGGNHGMLATAAKLLGLGGAGSGAAAGGSAAGGGAAVVGGGAIATKVAVIACCAAVVGGGAVEVQRVTAPAQAPTARVVQQQHPAAALPALAPISLPPRQVLHAVVAPHPAPAPKPTDQAAGTVPDPASPSTLPASDSPIVAQGSGGLLAPDEDPEVAPDDSPVASDDPVASTGATGTATAGTGTSSSGSPGAGAGSTSGAQSGPDGAPTGSSPPTAQGATAPGSTQTPS
jgi:RNA polymerase sigma factor (sigma-70 family)